MAITVNSEPGTHAPVRNPVGVELETDNLVTTAGVKESHQMSITASPAANDVLTFAWNGNSVAFTAKASPDNSGTQIQTQGAETLKEWVDTYLIPGMRQNYTLNEDFDIERTNDVATPVEVRVRAKLTGATYNLTITQTTGFVGFTLSELANGVTEVQRTDFEILLDVYMEDDYASGTYIRLDQKEATPDSDYIAIFRLEETLKPYLSHDKPSFNQATITRCSNIMKRYYYRYAEAFGEPQVVQKLSNPTLTTKHVILAGYGYKDFPASTFVANHITGNAGKKFLTTQPRTKTITTTQQEYLYLYNTATSGTMTIKLKVYYTDGTSSALTDKTTASAGYNQVYIFPVGYAQLAVAAVDSTKTVKYYEVYVYDVDHSSETFTYYVDHKRYRLSRYFLFLNSLGGMDTLWCSGQEEEIGMEVSMEEARLVEEYNYAATDAQITAYNAEFRDTVKVHTGWKTKEYIDHLRDLLISEAIYEIGSAAYIPVRLKPFSGTLYWNKSNKYSLELEFATAFLNEAYNP